MLFFRKKIRSDYQAVLLLIISLILLFIIAYPFFILILKSFGIGNYNMGDFSVDSYVKVLKDPQLFSSLSNTLIISAGVTILTFLVGGSLAWLVTRTDFKHKRMVKSLVFLTFTIPAYVLGISWLEIFARNGYLSRIYNSLGLDYNINVYSVFSVIIVMSIHLYPLVFIALENAFKRLDNSLEDAAILSGASRTKVFFTITFPLVLPTVWSVGLFVFSRSMANFGVPALLLMPIYKETLTTGIYRSLNNLDLSSAASISMILVVISGLVFIIQYIFMRRKKFTTISSDTGKPKLIELGKKNNIITLIVFTVQFLTTVLPIIVLVITSFMKHWGLSIEMKNFTLRNYKVLFTSELSRTAFKNSLLFGATAALIAIIISAVIAYIINFRNRSVGKTLEFTASFPMVIPNIVMAIAAILAWNSGIINFYGTATIIVITYAALFLPVAMKQISGISENYERSLEQAARISGASSIRAAKDILFPFVFPAMKSSFILCVLIALREIPIALMLHAKGTETVGVLLFNMRSNSAGLEAVSTVATLVIAVSIIGRFIFVKSNKKKGIIENDTGKY